MALTDFLVGWLLLIPFFIVIIIIINIILFIRLTAFLVSLHMVRLFKWWSLEVSLFISSITFIHLSNQMNLKYFLSFNLFTSYLLVSMLYIFKNTDIQGTHILKCFITTDMWLLESSWNKRCSNVHTCYKLDTSSVILYICSNQLTQHTSCSFPRLVLMNG